MKNTTPIYLKFCFQSALLLILLSSCISDSVSIENHEPESVLIWNENIMAFAIEQDGLLSLNGVRTEAMAAIAAHNALNSIHPVYSFYDYGNSSPQADPFTAVNQAFYEIVKTSFPKKEKELRELLDGFLSTIPDSKGKEAGILLGKATAQNTLKKRAKDSWNGEANYTWHPMGPGVYAEFNEHSGTPEGFVFGAGWAAASPFILASIYVISQELKIHNLGGNNFYALFDLVASVIRLAVGCWIVFLIRPLIDFTL